MCLNPNSKTDLPLCATQAQDHDNSNRAMNSKIAFPELIDLVAQATNSTKRVSELFLKELFATITQALAEGESVKVKSLGTFKLTEVSARKSVNVNTGETIEIPGHTKLSFVPDKALAEAVNKPFAQFETVVLSDDVTDEQLQAIDDGQQPAEAIEAPPEAPAAEEEQPAEEQGPAEPIMPTEPTAEPAEEKPVEEQGQPETPPPFVPPAIEEPQPATEPEAPQEQPAPEPEKPEEPLHHHHHHHSLPVDSDDDYITYDEIAALERKATVKGFLWGVVATLVLCGAAAFFYIDHSAKSEAQPAELVDDSVQQPAPAPASQPKTKADTAAKQQPAAAADKTPADTDKQQKEADAKQVVYDTTSRNYVLSKMAQKHYGNQCFWVYIYQENKGKIKDPNNIPEGTRLVIPAKEKYGIDSRDKASRDKAKKIAYNLLKDKGK